MARVLSLAVNDVRSIESARLSFSPHINLIDGLNGSGKTSLLESIYMLASAKSFRSGSNQSLVRKGQDAAVVYGEIDSGSGSRKLGVKLGITGDRQLRLDGSPVRSTDESLRILPVMVIDSESFKLALGSPSERRKFVDWGVFHVEHRFLEAWRRTQRALKQRNSLLRRGNISDSSMDGWEKELASSAQQVDSYRSAYIYLFISAFDNVRRQLSLGGDNDYGVELSYRRGWDRDARRWRARWPRDRAHRRRAARRS